MTVRGGSSPETTDSLFYSNNLLDHDPYLDTKFSKSLWCEHCGCELETLWARGSVLMPYLTFAFSKLMYALKMLL